MAFATTGNMGSEVIDFLIALVNAKKPLLAGVDGLAIGVGTTIHFHCDLTFATPQSFFKTPFVDLGLVPEAGSSLLGPALMGHQRAFAFLAMGDGLNAVEAKEAGLVYKLVETEELESTVLKVATEIAAKPPEAMQISRDLLRMPRRRRRRAYQTGGKAFRRAPPVRGGARRLDGLSHAQEGLNSRIEPRLAPVAFGRITAENHPVMQAKRPVVPEFDRRRAGCGNPTNSAGRGISPIA